VSHRRPNARHQNSAAATERFQKDPNANPRDVARELKMSPTTAWKIKRQAQKLRSVNDVKSMSDELAGVLNSLDYSRCGGSSKAVLLNSAKKLKGEFEKAVLTVDRVIRAKESLIDRAKEADRRGR